MSIYRTLIETGKGHFDVYLDIDGHSVAGGTIPPHILVTAQRPDLVVIWEEPKKILLIELTVPFESNIPDTHKTKIERYEPC